MHTKLKTENSKLQTSKTLSRCLLAFGLAAFTAQAAEPLYQNNFEETQIGEVPDDFLVLDGDFAVKQEGGNKYLELPGAPLDAFGFMFGPSARHGNEISARMFGTKKGRRYPVFGIALNGVNGYRLQVAPAKRAIELLKGSTVVAKVPFRWGGGEWLRLALQVEQTGAAEWIISGRVWLPTIKSRTGQALHHAQGNQGTAQRQALHLGKPLLRHPDSL